MGQKQMISTILVDILSSLKEIVISKAEKYTYIKKKSWICRFFSLPISPCTKFTQMYFDKRFMYQKGSYLWVNMLNLQNAVLSDSGTREL